MFGDFQHLPLFTHVRNLGSLFVFSAGSGMEGKQFGAMVREDGGKRDASFPGLFRHHGAETVSRRGLLQPFAPLCRFFHPVVVFFRFASANGTRQRPRSIGCVCSFLPFDDYTLVVQLLRQRKLHESRRVFVVACSLWRCVIDATCRTTLRS